MYNQTPLLDCCYNKKLTIARGDTRDKPLMTKLIKDADAIFPLACLTGAPLCNKDPHGAQTVIVDAVRMMLELRGKAQSVIYPTTNSGYGIGQKGKYCTEEVPLRPISLYGRLKAGTEKILLEAGNSITLRLA